MGPLYHFVNSFPDSVKCKCVVYADDTTLLVNSSDPVTLQVDLRRNLHMIANWFESDQLNLYIKETNLMLFGTSQQFFDINLKVNLRIFISLIMMMMMLRL